MPRARENISLTSTDYDISGNTIRAYRDGAHKLIFVLDETINADKPNVLLVIDSFDERKWDDVLANDYNVDLETVRPKRDNKYQKLDIEYGGLDVYDDLISAYESGDDLSNALDNLTRFRAMSVRRAARERLAAAEDIINKSRDTIERTNETIGELREKIKDLRARVTKQRREIGREPTKESAAKILKSEAQIDATNEKLARAKKRLTNAQRRLASAEDDAEIARAILARDVPQPAKRNVAARRTAHKPQPVVTEPIVPEYDEDAEFADDEEDAFPEPKADEMNDDEVKPLFDKDPENLDDEIAFKPIDFGATTDAPTTSSDEDAIAPAPLSFTPPQSYNNYEQNETPATSPMLDSLTSVPQSDEIVSQDKFGDNDTSGDDTDVSNVVPEPIAPVEQITPIEQIEPVAPVAPVTPVRPVSPIVAAAAPVEQKPQKPTLMYYLLLILLILLSIGTLWLYQKSTNENVPDLSKPVSNVVAETNVKQQKVAEPTPFLNVPDIAKRPIVQEPESVVVPEPVAAPVVEPEPVVAEPEPVAIVEPEPIAIEPEPITVVESEPVVIEPEPTPVVMPTPVVEDSPFLTFEPVTPIAKYEPEPVKIPSEEEVIASKPGYNVSQNEKMFVASPEYDTDTLVVDGEEPEIPLCEGGAAPDSLGCCPGESYQYTDDGFMCCSADECFPPLE